MTDSIGQAVKDILPSMTWFLPLLWPLVCILLLLLFCPCLFNLPVKFMSSRLQQFHLKMMVLQKFQPVPPETEDSDLTSLLSTMSHRFRLLPAECTGTTPLSS